MKSLGMSPLFPPGAHTRSAVVSAALRAADGRPVCVRTYGSGDTAATVASRLNRTQDLHVWGVLQFYSLTDPDDGTGAVMAIFRESVDVGADRG